MNFDLNTLRTGYRDGLFTPADVVREAYERIRQRGERPVWIHLIPEEESIARAEALGRFRDDLPLLPASLSPSRTIWIWRVFPPPRDARITHIFLRNRPRSSRV